MTQYAPGIDPLFDRIADEDIKRHEGPFEDDPDDPGGATAWGWDLRDNPDLALEDLRAMTWDQAKARYYERYWKPYRWGDLPVPIVRKVFDVAVDIGIKPAIICLQRACRAAGAVLAEDGALGVATIGAAGRFSTAVVLAALKSELAAHYRLVLAVHPKEEKYRKGWLSRAYE